MIERKVSFDSEYKCIVVTFSDEKGKLVEVDYLVDRMNRDTIEFYRKDLIEEDRVNFEVVVGGVI